MHPTSASIPRSRRRRAGRPFPATWAPALPAATAAVLALAALPLLLAPPFVRAQEAAGGEGADRPAPPLTPALTEELTFRLPGPAVTGGRIHDVEALPDDPSTVYVATASGGLWKTTNQGTTWEPIFDDQPVSTFGDVAVAPSDPDVIWAGTGEQQNRQSTSWGNGVYRSTDGGRSWTHLGLEETRHIGAVRVHPEDPDVAWVAALGNLWTPSEARGVYKTTDAGRTWQKSLYVDTLTGVVDMELDPSDPDVLYAASYQRLRRTWGFNGGGPGSGVWKTTDGGETWSELSEGLPEGDLGRIGLAVAPSDPSILYATVEHAEEEGTYRSEDAGATWTKVNDLDPRPMYYSHIHVDPADPDRVYVLSTEFYMSENGGGQFREMPTRPTYDVGVHSDHHTMWIDPGNPEHFYLAGDAGLHETFDRGETYKRINNFPIAQFYAIGLDDRDPYWIYGGLQDNHSFAGPSATRWWIGILNDDWRQTGFGDGMYQQPEPGTHRRVYVLAQNGNITRVDGETGDRLSVEPAPPEDQPDAGEETAAGETEARPSAEEGPEEYRFDWVTPALVSRHDPSTVYLGGNRLFISRDRGESWSRTEDLTKRIDRDTLTLMGVAGADIQLSRNDGTASFGEITTIAESPGDADVLWVGTDDGNVQVSRDGGESWTEVGRNVPGIPATAYVSRVTASGSAPGAAWVAVDLHRRGDFAPYLFRTEDFGETWTPAVGDLPASAGSVNEVLEHPRNPDLLFLGAEHGLFVSADRGAHWSRLGSNLPTTLYDDVAIQARENALVVGTHGRSLWILDDLTPLEEWSAATAAAPAHLFSVKDATFFHYWKRTSYRGQGAYAGENPTFGATLHYHLAEPADPARVVISREDGTVVRTLEVPGTAGTIHRVHWDLRHPPPPTDEDEEDEEPEEERDVVKSERELPVLPHPLEDVGSFVSPGTYRATLLANGTESAVAFEVRADPEMPIAEAQYRDREAWLLELAALQRRAFEASERASDLRDAREPPDEEEASAEERERFEAARDLARRLNRLRFRLYGLAGAFNGGGVQQGSLYPPTPTHREVRDRLERELEGAVRELEAMEGGGAGGAP